MYMYYVCIHLLIVEGKSLQIQHKYFNINIVYSAPKSLSTTFNTKQKIKLSSMTQYCSNSIQFTQLYRISVLLIHAFSINMLNYFHLYLTMYTSLFSFDIPWNSTFSTFKYKSLSWGVQHVTIRNWGVQYAYFNYEVGCTTGIYESCIYQSCTGVYNIHYQR